MTLKKVWATKRTRVPLVGNGIALVWERNSKGEGGRMYKVNRLLESDFFLILEKVEL